MEKIRDRQVVVDVDSGEVRVQAKLGRNEVGAYGEKLKPNTGFVMMWPEEMRRLGLTRAQWDVLAVLVQRMNPKTGAVQFYAEELREELGYAHKTVVSKVVRQLIERGAVRRVPSARGVHAINPRLAWNGKAQDRTAAIFVWEQMEQAA